MRRWKQKKDDTETALANFALTFAKALLVFCVILFVMIEDDKKLDDGIKPKVEAVIMVDWNKEAKVDIDTWVRNPAEELVFYNSKEAGVVFLDRDDLGGNCESICEEIVSVRGLVPGEYVVNLNVFSARGIQNDAPLSNPLSVHIKILKMNPKVIVLFETDVILEYTKQEKHVVRFRIHEGNIDSFETSRDIKLMERRN